MMQKRQRRSFVKKINIMNKEKKFCIIHGAIISSPSTVIAVSPGGYAERLISFRVTRFIIICLTI